MNQVINHYTLGLRHDLRFIMATTKVSREEAEAIEEMINRNYLVDWSEASARQIKTAIKTAQALIAVDGDWEKLA